MSKEAQDTKFRNVKKTKKEQAGEGAYA